MSAESAELADAVRRVTDELAMQRVMVNYARGIDRRNWDLVRSCFTADAFVHGTSFEGPLDTYLDILRPGVEHFPATQHFIGNQLRELNGDKGFTETYLIARHFADAAGEVDSLIIGVRYEDQLVRRGEGWAIQRRDVFTVWKRVGEPVPTS
ncbi:MAG TPA: nuclear transport factor 2 family protein [Acidimicrobiales bacterium]